MGYSRNFEFRVPPKGGQRAGRYVVDAATNIGAPVIVSGSPPNIAVTEDDALPVTVAGDAAGVPKNGFGGILVYEEIFTDFAGDSPSDAIQAPAGAKVQVVSGPDVKVAFRNSTALTIVNMTNVDVGDGLDTVDGGTWAVTAGSNPWLTVTDIDSTIPGEEVVEARFNF